MEQSKALMDKINYWLIANQDKFPPEKMPILRSSLENIEESTLNSLMMLDFKSPLTIFLLTFFLGGFSIDRFLLGDTGVAIARLLTLQGLGIWVIVELFTSFKRTREYNFKLLNAIINR